MRLVVFLGLGVGPLYAQVCAPVRMLPVGTITGILDNSSCQLSDATAYAAYRLDLPARGQMALDLTTAADMILLLRDASGARIGSGASIHQPLEAGSYTVLVDGHVPGQVGSYAVQSAFTIETGVLCSAFPSLGLAQTAAGRLGASGCAMPDAALYEGYWLNTFGAGTLTVTVSSTDFTPSVIVRSGDGAAVASGGTSVTAMLDADSQYEVVVSTADNTGAYQIATAFTPADGETCRAVMSFTDPAQDAGTISGASCAAVIDGSGDLVYYNYYSLQVTAPGLADIVVTSTDFAPALYLLDDGGNTIAINSSGGGTSSEVRMQLQPGSYTVELDSAVASGGAYSLSYQFTAGAPQRCAAAALNPGDSPTGSLSAASCHAEIGLGDLYGFTLAGPGTVNFSLASNSFTATLAIRDAKDNLVIANQDFEGVGRTTVSADLPAGGYTIAAAADAGWGPYQMTSAFTAHDLGSCGNVQTIDSNGGYVQRLGVGTCVGPNGQPVDWYQFTLAADGVVAAFMTSGALDGFLTLTDASGNVLRADANSYDGIRDPMIVEYLPAGTYLLAARAARAAVNGLYEVDVRNTPGPRPPFCAPQGTLAPGSSVTGTIGYTSCQYSGTFADIYQVQVTDGATLDLQLDSSDFDAYLYLLDAQGNLVDQDDDSGGNTNARITALLGAGTYYVVATPLGDYTQGGAYTLSAQ